MYAFIVAHAAFLKDLVKTLIGTFAGAGLAFWAARSHDARKRYRENIAAGNLALFTITKQFEEFLQFRKGLFNDGSISRGAHAPLWLSLRPSYQAFVGHQVDFNSLGFLFEKTRYGPTFTELHRVQSFHDDLIQADKFRTEYLVELQRTLSKMDIGRQAVINEQTEQEIGLFLVESASAGVIGATRRALEGEQIYLIAHASLRTALLEELDVWWRRGFRKFHLLVAFLGRQPAIINMSHDDLMQLRALPTLSQNLLDAVNSAREGEAAQRQAARERLAGPNQ